MAAPPAPQHNHSDTGDTDGAGVRADSGLSEHSKAFQDWCHLDPPFDLECSGCCWIYLVNTRQYTTAQDARIVRYGKAATYTACYVDGPQGKNGQNGVVKTNKDPTLGELVDRPFSSSRSYQLYRPIHEGERVDPPPPVVLAMGEPVTARIEAIAVIELRESKHDLQGCQLNYCDAALLELFRATQTGVASDSMKGRCCWPLPVPEPKPKPKPDEPIPKPDVERKPKPKPDVESLTMKMEATGL